MRRFKSYCLLFRPCLWPPLVLNRSVCGQALVHSTQKCPVKQAHPQPFPRLHLRHPAYRFVFPLHHGIPARQHSVRVQRMGQRRIMGEHLTGSLHTPVNSFTHRRRQRAKPFPFSFGRMGRSAQARCCLPPEFHYSTRQAFFACFFEYLHASGTGKPAPPHIRRRQFRGRRWRGRAQVCHKVQNAEVYLMPYGRHKRHTAGIGGPRNGLVVEHPQIFREPPPRATMITSTSSRAPNN